MTEVEMVDDEFTIIWTSRGWKRNAGAAIKQIVRDSTDLDW
jgi:hypothetical protein